MITASDSPLYVLMISLHGLIRGYDLELGLSLIHI